MTKKLVFLLLFTNPLWAAINAGCVWEIRTTGAQNNGGGFVWTSLVNATYKWTAGGGGTNEYYCQAAAGGNPSLIEPTSVTTDGNYNLAANGTMDSLAAGEWDWGDSDGLGYSTLYVRLADGTDPDTKIARGQPGYVSYGLTGGTDYSQQANPVRTWVAATGTYTNDLSLTNATPSVMTSASYNFTSIDNGNIVHLTAGDHITPGWYQIVSVAAGAATLSAKAITDEPHANGTGYEGGALLLGGTLDDELLEAAVAGNRWYIALGTYTTGETIQVTAAGNTTDSISVLGYNGTRGDTPLGNNRPLIDGGANNPGFRIDGGYYYIANLHFTTSAPTYALYCLGTCTTVFNIYAGNAAVGGRGIALLGAYCTALGCEATASTNIALALGATAAVKGCYLHDSAMGIFTASSSGRFLGCVIDTCTTGMDLDGGADHVDNCTIYGCTTGIDSGSVNDIITNCILSGNTTGFKGVSALNVVAYCCLDNTTDFSETNPALKIGNIFGDPGLADPANGDFRVDSSDANVYQQGVDVGYFTPAKTY